MFLTGKLFCQTSVGKRWCILAWGFVRKLGLPTAVQKSQRFPLVSITKAVSWHFPEFPRSQGSIHTQFSPASLAHTHLSFESCPCFHQSPDSVSVSWRRSQEAEERCWRAGSLSGNPTSRVALGASLTETPRAQAFTYETAVTSSNLDGAQDLSGLVSSHLSCLSLLCSAQSTRRGLVADPDRAWVNLE